MRMARLEKTFTIVNSLGLHARPAAQLVQAANRHRSEISFTKDGTTVNAKSIMGVLTLAAAKGSLLSVTCEGDDAESALAVIGKMIEAGFGEK
jgi:phosphocarrier protein HPr